jgi:hypothetical protein
MADAPSGQTSALASAGGRFTIDGVRAWAAKVAGLIGAAALALSLAGTAHAAGCDAGSAKAKYLTLSTADEAARTALAAAIFLGLNPFSFPQDRIAAVTQPCKRRDFHARDGLYTLYGDIDGEPQRYAMRKADLTRVAYLAELPLPAPAFAALRAGSKNGNYTFKNGQMIFVLAVTEGYQRNIFHFYDAIPDDQTLAIDMCAALSGDDMPIGTYNSSFGTTTFYAPAPPRGPRRMTCRIVIS